MSLPIPARHPDRPQPVPAAIGSFATMLAIGKPDAAQWERLGERLECVVFPVGLGQCRHDVLLVPVREDRSSSSHLSPTMGMP